MIACTRPRCCECAHPMVIDSLHLFGRWTAMTCVFCMARLQVRTTSTGYAIRPATEAMRLAVTPLPAVASPALRHRFLTACRSVGALLRRDGVEPGMGSIEEHA